MKGRLASGAVASIAIVICIGIYVSAALQKRSQCALAFALADLLSEYAAAHQNSLPASWDSLEQWDRSRGGQFLANADALKNNIEIDWARRDLSARSGKPLIKIHGNSLKNCQDNVNARFPY